MMMLRLENDFIQKDMENIFQRDLEWDALNNKTILITGAYGMLASYLVLYLAYLNEAKGFHIRILAQGRDMEKMADRFGDLTEKDYFKGLSFRLTDEIDIQEDVHYIIHAAGGANPRLYATSPVEVAEANSIGIYQLLQLARKKQVESFLFFSSGDVYGKVDADIYEITETDMGKTDPLSPHACYTESKRMGETFCDAFWREYGVPTKIARIGHTYAPSMDLDNDPRVFASFVKCIKEKRDIVMLSDGRARRPFCYITDAIAAYFIILLRGENGTAYNVCNTDEFLSIKELADILVSLKPELGLKVVRLDRNKSDKYVENNENVENKPVSDRLKKLGWTPEFTAKMGFENVVRYVDEEN